MVPAWWKRRLHPGDTGPDASTVMRLLGLPDGPLDDNAVFRLRGLAQRAGVYFRGVVDQEMAEVLGPSVTDGWTPEWFFRPLRLGDRGDDVARAREILRAGPGDEFDMAVEQAVRRFQSQYQVRPTGTIDESLARLMGE